MAHAQSNSKNTEANGNISAGGGESELKSSTFHDFLGNKGKRQESAPAIGGGGIRTPLDFSASATSEQASERHVNNHLEGIPFYGSRGEHMGPESSYRFSGNKRSNSDSFMVSRDKLPHGQPDSQDNPVLTKVMRYSGGEQHRQPHDEETFVQHQLKPIPSTFISQSSHGGRTDANNPKWDRAIPGNLGPGSQYPPRSGQVTAFGYQTLSSKVKDTNLGTSVISLTAADEGSRTGIKGSGILSSINTGGISGRQPSGVLIRKGEQKSGICVSEPEPSISPSQRGTESSSRQMTIFYGGQAHVFDNIHPNKADAIMALAGSNGGSWSTAYTSNFAVGPPSTGENQIPGGGENDVAISILRELQGRSSDKEDAFHGFSSGNYQAGIRTKEKIASFKETKSGAGEKLG